MSSIDLNLDEENELTFQVNVEGSRPATAKCRLSIINEDMNLLFNADKFEDNNVSITLPPLKHVLKEGEYDMTLEVIVEDKYFTPLTITGNFEKSIKITAESVQKVKKKNLTPSATFVSKNATKPKPKVISEKTKRRTVKKRKPVKKISDQDIMRIIQELASK